MCAVSRAVTLLDEEMAHDVPLPYAPALEDFVLPQTDDVVRAARRLAAY